MKTTRWLLAALAIVGLAACEGGGVDLNVANTDNSVDNSGGGDDGGSDNPCATYTPTGSAQAVRGSFDGTNCVYGSSFVGQTNPMLVDLTIPFITGKHIFQDSLFVGDRCQHGRRAGGRRRPDADDCGRQHAGIPGFRRLRPDQPRLAHHRRGLIHVPDHLYLLYRRDQQHRGRQRRAAVGRNRHQWQRNHQ